jgi:hypothetical protein
VDGLTGDDQCGDDGALLCAARGLMTRAVLPLQEDPAMRHLNQLRGDPA